MAVVRHLANARGRPFAARQVGRINGASACRIAIAGNIRMSRSGEIDPSPDTQEPFAEKRALRRRKIINNIMNVIVVVGIAIDLFFAILYSVLDARAYAVAIGVNLANAALWAMTPLFRRWPGPFAGVWFLGVFIAAMLSFTLLLARIGVTFVFDSRRDLFADLSGPAPDYATGAHYTGRMGSFHRRGQGFASLAIPHPDVDITVGSSFLRHISTDDVCALPHDPIFNPSG
jgi:hypothetical protein